MISEKICFIHVDGDKEGGAFELPCIAKDVIDIYGQGGTLQKNSVTNPALRITMKLSDELLDGGHYYFKSGNNPTLISFLFCFCFPHK